MVEDPLLVLAREWKYGRRKAREGLAWTLEAEVAVRTRPPCGRIGGSSAASFCVWVTGFQAETGWVLNKRETNNEMS